MRGHASLHSFVVFHALTCFQLKNKSVYQNTDGLIVWFFLRSLFHWCIHGAGSFDPWILSSWDCLLLYNFHPVNDLELFTQILIIRNSKQKEVGFWIFWAKSLCIIRQYQFYIDTFETCQVDRGHNSVVAILNRNLNHSATQYIQNFDPCHNKLHIHYCDSIPHTQKKTPSCYTQLQPVERSSIQ